MSVVRFKFRCNILISGKIIKEMPGSVASGAPYRTGQAADDMVVRCMRIARCILKATNTHIYTHTHTQYVILIAFLLLQWLHERDSVLRHAYIACLV